MTRHAGNLETVSVTVPDFAVPAYESAIQQACATIGIFVVDEAGGLWRVEGVKQVGQNEAALQSGLVVAGWSSGVEAALDRAPTEAEGWLSRVYAGFPEQKIGARFAIRGAHVQTKRVPGRITLTVDAGLAFGSGEHGSTRGCLRALQNVSHRRPSKILDLGCGTAILAMGAAALLHRPVLAVDIDPWSVRVSAQNARLNGLNTALRCRLGNGVAAAAVRHAAPYDLVFANILARPLCLMAHRLARLLAPHATLILAGLLRNQMRGVLAAYRRQGLRLEFSLFEEEWTTMVLRK